MSTRIFGIRQTGMGAYTRAIPLDDTVQVEERWGRTHGEARVSGKGRLLLIDVSNLGNHRCVLYELGDELKVLEQVGPTKFCPLCEKFALQIEDFELRRWRA